MVEYILNVFTANQSWGKHNFRVLVTLQFMHRCATETHVGMTNKIDTLTLYTNAWKLPEFPAENQ